MSHRLTVRTGALAVAILASSGAARAADGIAVSGAVSRATPAGAPTGVGYLTLTNGAATADRLVSAASPAADHVEIHEMSIADGVMSMRPVSGGLAIPAHGSVTLKPGGYHLMLIGPKHPFVAGETLPVTLTFERAGPERVDLAVQPLGAVAPALQHQDAPAPAPQHQGAVAPAMNR